MKLQILLLSEKENFKCTTKLLKLTIINTFSVLFLFVSKHVGFFAFTEYPNIEQKYLGHI